MVLIQEHKTYFLSSRLHLPHGVGEEEPTATFRHITYVNINGVSGNGRLQSTLNVIRPLLTFSMAVFKSSFE
jgi:hypothetical protein